MPNYYSRLNLASAIFPFYQTATGRTIMVPEIDENFDRYNAANTTPDKGVPQVFYMHNVLPINNGFQSIGYNTKLAGMSNTTDFDTAFSLYNSDLSNFIFVPAAGKNYIFDGAIGAWQSVSPLATGAVAANVLVTTAYVKGTTYIYYANYGCFSYNSVNKTLVPVTLAGLTATNVIGICESNGSLIAWSSTAVTWSSVTNPTDFVPSVQTGAGGGVVQDAKGSINFCMRVGGGFLMYCQKNIVGAQFTGNLSFPYIIQEVPGSGGVGSIDNVGYQSNLPYHIAYTSTGMQQISLGAAIPTMPEVSDFLTAKIFEDFDEIKLTFSTTYTASQVYTKLAYVSSRFAVISYGVSSSNFTHAIVYDFLLNRYGKLKLLHRCAFSFDQPAPYGLIRYNQLMSTPLNTLANSTYRSLFTTLQLAKIPKENLAFLQQDGTVVLVDFAVSEATASGVFIIGKLQYRRNNMFVHHRTDVETITPSALFNMYLLPTFNGKDFSPAVATNLNKLGNLTRTFAKRYTASNISLCLIGAFDLTSVVVLFTVGGSR